MRAATEEFFFCYVGGHVC